jgi:hypothetical protein
VVVVKAPVVAAALLVGLLSVETAAAEQTTSDWDRQTLSHRVDRHWNARLARDARTQEELIEPVVCDPDTALPLRPTAFSISNIRIDGPIAQVSVIIAGSSLKGEPSTHKLMEEWVRVGGHWYRSGRCPHNRHSGRLAESALRVEEPCGDYGLPTLDAYCETVDPRELRNLDHRKRTQAPLGHLERMRKLLHDELERASPTDDKLQSAFHRAALVDAPGVSPLASGLKR